MHSYDEHFPQLFRIDVISHFSLKSDVYLKVELDYLQFLIVEKLNKVVFQFYRDVVLV